MATQSPFLLLESLLRDVAARVEPPAWLVQEAQRRLILLFNHVLLQEPVAAQRLRRHAGQTVLVQWQAFSIELVVTRAGLFDLGQAGQDADLRLTITEPSAGELAQAALRGDKPAVRIDGDVQLAAEVNWLVDHVRWDMEEDMARLLGDAPAHLVAGLARRVMEGVAAVAGVRKPEHSAGPRP